MFVAFSEFFGSCISDPLVHHGRHFGRTLHAMTNVQVLLTNGILRMGELADQPQEAFTAQYVILVCCCGPAMLMTTTQGKEGTHSIHQIAPHGSRTRSPPDEQFTRGGDPHS